MKHILILCMLMFVSACSTSSIQTYGIINPTQKTITVPAGSGGLKGPIKKLLHEQGWSMSVYSGASRLEGSSGKEISLQSYDTFLTRYNLLLSSRRFDTCLEIDGKVTGGFYYDISVIDNKSGSEMITMDGSGCEYRIMKDIRKGFQSLLP